MLSTGGNAASEKMRELREGPASLIAPLVKDQWASFAVSTLVRNPVARTREPRDLLTDASTKPLTTCPACCGFTLSRTAACPEPACPLPSSPAVGNRQQQLTKAPSNGAHWQAVVRARLPSFENRYRGAEAGLHGPAPAQVRTNYRIHAIITASAAIATDPDYAAAIQQRQRVLRSSQELVWQRVSRTQAFVDTLAEPLYFSNSPRTSLAARLELRHAKGTRRSFACERQTDCSHAKWRGGRPARRRSQPAEATLSVGAPILPFALERVEERELLRCERVQDDRENLVTPAEPKHGSTKVHCPGRAAAAPRRRARARCDMLASHAK